MYRLHENKLSVWFKSDEIPYPNGVLVQGDSLIIANYALKNGEGLMRKQWKTKDFGSIYRIDLKSKAMTLIPSSTKKGVYDGVIEFNGTLMVSSPATGQLLAFEENKSRLINRTNKGIADINTDGKIIYAPNLFNNKLTAFQAVVVNL